MSAAVIPFSRPVPPEGKGLVWVDQINVTTWLTWWKESDGNLHRLAVHRTAEGADRFARRTATGCNATLIDNPPPEPKGTA